VSLRDTAAVAGIGATEFSKNSGRSELQLAAESISAALDDAGLSPADVDGLVTFSLDTSPENEVAECLGIPDLSFFSRVHFGGGAGCGCLLHAAMAVTTGVADVVVCYRALNERSGLRFGEGMTTALPLGPTEMASFGWYGPSGMVTPAHWTAMVAQRYLDEFGATSEDFGRVAVASRSWAATNPNAFFYDNPITLADHQNSRWVVEPLHLLDCCQESDGAQAIVVTTAERARDLSQQPVLIRAAAQGSVAGEHLMTSYYRPEITGLPSMGAVAERLYAMSGLGPADIQLTSIYDHFTPYVLIQLEEFGFCGRGEAKDFLRSGAIDRGGSLPTNTNGGQLGEAYIHGMNGIAEVVRQIRGTACNQIDGVENALVTSGTALPTSAAILSRDSGDPIR
jgi:acetyl-CoA acetyltransferase